MKIFFSHRTFRRLLDIVRSFQRWLERCHLRVYAAQASFFLVISALPMLLLLLSLLGLILPREGSVLVNATLDGLPDELRPLIEGLVTEVSEKASASVLSISAITLLWSSSRGVRGIGAGVRNVYGGKKERHFLVYSAKSVGCTLLYLLSVLLALIVWVFGDQLLRYAPEGSPHGLLRLLNGSALFLLLVGLFALTYRGFSGRKIPFFSGVPGALFSALGWLLYSAFFEYYVTHFADYSYVYGSLAALIIVMLWLYSCMEILLIGAGINVFLYERATVF